MEKILMKLTVLLTLAAPVLSGSDDYAVPEWAIRGIAWTETRSYWNAEKEFKYVDRRTGSAGELGPMQLSPGGFAQVMHAGEHFGTCQKNPDYAMRLSVRYLLWLRRHTTSWGAAIAAYNVGLHGSRLCGQKYLAKVRNAGMNLCLPH